MLTDTQQEYWIVGCGGVGAWLASLLHKTAPLDVGFVLWDGDTLEERNLDRQFFTLDDLEVNKACALACRLEESRKGRVVRAMSCYFDPLKLQSEKHSNVRWIFCGVDNHPARAAVLKAVDLMINPSAVCAANEFTTAEAFVYHSRWLNTCLDPRRYYPEILTDTQDDPLHPPCTGAEQVAHPQLAVSNMMAASYAAWLYWFWEMEAGDLPDEAAFPVQVMSNFAKIRTITTADKGGTR